MNKFCAYKGIIINSITEVNISKFEFHKSLIIKPNVTSKM